MEIFIKTYNIQTISPHLHNRMNNLHNTNKLKILPTQFCNLKWWNECLADCSQDAGLISTYVQALKKILGKKDKTCHSSKVEKILVKT